MTVNVLQRNAMHCGTRPVLSSPGRSDGQPGAGTQRSPTAIADECARVRAELPLRVRPPPKLRTQTANQARPFTPNWEWPNRKWPKRERPNRERPKLRNVAAARVGAVSTGTVSCSQTGEQRTAWYHLRVPFMC